MQNLDLSEILPLLESESDQSIGMESAIRYDFDPMIFESASKSMLTSKTHLDFSILSKQMNQYIYAIGGFIENTKFCIERFDIQKQEWSEVGFLENNRAKFQAVCLAEKGSIVILGGKKNGVRIETCEEFDIEKKIWKEMKMKLPTVKSGFGALAKESKETRLEKLLLIR